MRDNDREKSEIEIIRLGKKIDWGSTFSTYIKDNELKPKRVKQCLHKSTHGITSRIGKGNNWG